MRIVSGLARGIRLAVPEDGGVRPTEDKVKESLFSTLGDLRGARILDLFSGTGALGLEALSRGASRVVMVEKDPRHLAVMRENLQRVRKAMAPHPPGEVELLGGDAAQIHRRLSPGEHFDILLADPPYHTRPGQYGARELLLDSGWLPFLAEGAILVLEHHVDTADLPWSPRSPWRLLREKSFGIRALAYGRIAVPESAP